jgi:hypothetical protein
MSRQFTFATFPTGNYELTALSKTKKGALDVLRVKWNELGKNDPTHEADYFDDNLDGITYRTLTLDKAELL